MWVLEVEHPHVISHERLTIVLSIWIGNHSLEKTYDNDLIRQECISLRDHPVYFALCVLFAIAIEFIILRRLRARSHSQEDRHGETNPGPK